MMDFIVATIVTQNDDFIVASIVTLNDGFYRDNHCYAK
jgi:hypothetical protein